MKEMEYQGRLDKPIILDNGEYAGVQYVILNLGTHPTAYIGIPMTHPLAGQDYDNISINVHGGLTFGRQGEDKSGMSSKYWWYGWDYAHSGDYYDYGTNSYLCGGDKHTTREILLEVKHAIVQFNQLQE